MQSGCANDLGRDSSSPGFAAFFLSPAISGHVGTNILVTNSAVLDYRHWIEQSHRSLWLGSNRRHHHASAARAGTRNFHIAFISELVMMYGSGTFRWLCRANEGSRAKWYHKRRCICFAYVCSSSRHTAFPSTLSTHLRMSIKESH
jgi:hypothetical protein